ncbi:MAG: hypothetical protein ACLUNQ_06715 [Oscillospiraceae bacterium]
MGLDGMVLLAFLLAFPANEIMLPILAMGYLSTSVMAEVDTLRLGLSSFPTVGRGRRRCARRCCVFSICPAAPPA